MTLAEPMASGAARSSGASPMAEAAACRTIALVMIGAFALARAGLACAIGFGVDESYTVAISRRLSLSYFDHPPLHQWLAHFAALLVGETVALRLPFVMLFAGTGWLMFVLTRNLFGPRAAVWAVFGLNSSAFFFVSAGAWVVPDGPLLFALAAAAIALGKLFFDEPTPGAAWRLWLAAGFWLGVAGLSKYSAVFAPVGILGFMALAPRQRRWFASPAPYVAALLCLALITPVLVWNAQNHWVSFAFQGERGAPGASLRPAQAGVMALGEIVWLTPWIFAPLAAGLIGAARRAKGDERRLFLLCLSAPAIALFTLTPLWGAKGLPHWPMPGWFFVFPLMGAWIAERRTRGTIVRGWAIVSTILLGVCLAVLAAQTATGWLTRILPSRPGAVDPTLEALGWDRLRQSPLLDGRGGAAPSFAVAMKWSDGGKIALALGQATPVIVYSNDPRGMAFLDDSAHHLGEDAVIIAPRAKLPSLAATFQPFFVSLGEPQAMALGRGGVDELDLALMPAHGLTRPFPAPYPR